MMPKTLMGMFENIASNCNPRKEEAAHTESLKG